MSDYPSFACPYCQIGHCQPGKATYVRMHAGHLIAVPQTAVWTCDICGYREFDREVMLRLDALLGVPEPMFDSGRIRPVDSLDSTTLRRVKP
jgi:hypothetical protein